MSLHQCSPASTNLPSQQPNSGSQITPGATTPLKFPAIARWSLAILPLTLLAPLITSCSLDQITAPRQSQAIPAQAAERSLDTSPPADALKARTAGELLDGEPPTELPQPSQTIPALMSQASSTANSELFPPTESGAHQGPLRVANQTEHPLRIAFLAQGEAPETPLTSPEDAAVEAGISPDLSETPGEPFHWDFAPAEGGRNGLLLALPEGDLALKDGDVIVAFAQDGSQRYWGPYVVGETSLPFWNGDRSEWQLLVQP